MIDLAVALFQDSPDAIIVADASGLIQLVNSQAELISRYPRAELRGKAVEMLVPGGPPSGAHRPSPA